MDKDVDKHLLYLLERQAKILEKIRQKKEKEGKKKQRKQMHYIDSYDKSNTTYYIEGTSNSNYNDGWMDFSPPFGLRD